MHRNDTALSLSPVFSMVSSCGYNVLMSNKIIGILALQGDFEKHRQMLGDSLGVKSVLVRTPQDLQQADALILPGGESTTIAKLMDRIGLDTAIQERAEKGMPLFGTCAGLILLSKTIQDRTEQPTLKLLDVTVARNAFGRQLDSFEANIPFQLQEDEDTVRGVFIRAPSIVEASPDVEVLSRYEEKIVGVRQGSILGIAFHPELTDDSRIHRLFLDMVDRSSEVR